MNLILEHSHIIFQAHIICDSMLESQETSSSSIIDWDMVASSVSSRYGISTTPAGLRQLWRAIAYDQDSTLQSDEVSMK